MPANRAWKWTAVMVLLFVSILSGCSGGNNGGKEGNSGELSANNQANNADAGTDKSDAGPVTINFWFPWSGDFQKDFKKFVVEPFEASHPNIKVKMTFVENSGNTQASDKLLTAVAGGKAPDVALFDRFMVGSWAEKGSLEDLTDLIAKDGVKPEDYYPSVWKEVNYKDRVYAMPWNTDNRGMYYNKTLMKKAGLDPEQPPKTIEELDRMAEAMFVKGKNGKFEQVGFIPWMGQGYLFTQGWNFGGQWEKDGQLTPNDPRIVKALEWMVGYSKKYDTATMNAFSDAAGQSGQNPFISGKVGFIFDGNWLLNDIEKYKADFEWGVAPMPAPEGYPSITWAGGWSYIMPKGAKHRDEAWEFIKYVAGKEGVLAWAKRPNAQFDITCLPAANEELGMTTKPNMSVFVNMMQTSFTRPVSPVSGFLWNEMFRVQDLALNNKGNPQQLLDDVKKNVDAELAKLKTQ
ncbi:ABC transporter substrate-binding protein [Paenibacillus gansuensis]|uniref:ABC transporter substrate-binding protein n=1 Tax=Paenibacillus gansuensis TaxID=306542 RepID=A0ABW5P7N8_9BACL